MSILASACAICTQCARSAHAVRTQCKHLAIGGILCDVLFNPKCAGCVYKVTVAIDSLGNIVWICPLAPGTSADVLIWDREGPKKVKGHYMDYEIGSMDGAYKGRLHVAWPFIGRKTLTERQKEYKDVHGFYRARIEHLFGGNIV